MNERKEVSGQFKYDQDSKRFHRFKIETKEGIVGTLYIPKSENVPDRITLIYTKQS